MPTTYFAGGEDTSFTFTGTVTVDTNASLHRGAWCREDLEVNAGSTADPPANRFTTPVFTAVSSMWVHAQLAWGGLGGASTLNATLLRLLDGSGVARLMVRGAGSGAVKISTRDSLGAFVDLVTSANSVLPVGGLSPFPVDFQVDYSATGFVNLYFNDTLVANFAGDVTTDGATQIAQADFADIDTGHPLYWSEVIISDSITINAGLFTLNPLASGVTQTWAGVVADINKTAINDTTFISDGNPTDLSGWTTPVTLPTGAWLVQSVVQEARVAVGLSGPQHFDWYVRTADGSDHTGGTSNAPSVTFSNFSNFIWPQNPHTSANWGTADIAAGFNLGLESLA